MKTLTAFGYTKLENKANRSSHNISFFNENDIKDQPLLQNISENQIEVLSNAGDDIDLMTVPSGILTPYDENRILYKKEIINNIEIFIYSNNEEDELYHVNFTNVGQNQGDYILLNDNAIENIYEYIPPINGEKQGNFQPIIKITAPEKLQLLTYNSTYQTSEKSKINIELATSKEDKNLFSRIDDSDNNGLASKINFKTENDIKNLKLNTEIDLNYIENKFKSIERIYNTEFSRDWDLNENILENYNQFFSKASFELSNNKFGLLNYKIENLNYDNYFKGVRNNINLESNKNKNLSLSSNNKLMESNQSGYTSSFINTKNKIQLNHKIGWAEILYNYERKKSNGIENILNPDFGQELYQIKKGFGDREKHL